MQEVTKFRHQQAPAEHVSLEGYFRTLSLTLPVLPFSGMNQIVDTIMGAFHEDRTIFVFGNGGSASTASHMACDLTKGTNTGDERRLKVMALTDNVPLMTAWANDFGYEHIFAEQLKQFAKAGDVAFGISTSGNSPNVLHALQAARDAEVTTVGLAGFHGGKMKALCDICAIIPSDNVQVIEDLHHSAAHAIFALVRHRLAAVAQDSLTGRATGTRG